MTDYKLVPVEPTPEMAEAAQDAYMPFGDMNTAIMMAVLEAPNHIAEARRKIGRPQIREAFLRNGAKIEPDRDDLPDWVYESVFELLEMAAPAVQVGPVAWMTHHDEPMLFLDEKDAAAYCDDDESPIPLYAAPQPATDVADYEQVLDDHRRLTRELDVLLNGEEGAAQQASLADLVAQLRTVVRNTGKPVLAAPDVDVLVARLSKVISELESGFVSCERCGDQEDTATLDCMPELTAIRNALAALAAMEGDQP